MSSCEILIDTNLVLHFKPIEQIDWPAVTGFENCTIVIAPILLRELEQKKVFSPSPTLKERADRMIRQLVAKMELPDPIALRPNVTLAFIEHETSIDFAAHQLAREINDDHYIAAALERQLASGEKTFIASNDGGMALKLRSRPIDILRLPEDLRLPDEPDAVQKELREARLELARLKASAPKLSLVFSDRSTRLGIVERTQSADSIPSLAQIMAEHQALPLPGEDLPPDDDPKFRLRATFAQRRVESAREYNEAVSRYFEKYEAYLEEHGKWANLERHMHAVTFILMNDGSGTATDIDITVRFPQTVFLMRLSDKPEEPSPPKPPSKHRTMASYLGASGGLGPSFDPIRLSNLAFYDGSPSILEGDPHTVRFSMKSLKQKCEFELEPFVMYVDPQRVGRGMELEVDITYHEGAPVEHKLAVTIGSARSTS